MLQPSCSRVKPSVAVRGADVAAGAAREVIVLGLVVELELAPGHDVAEPADRVAGELHLAHEGVVFGRDAAVGRDDREERVRRRGARLQVGVGRDVVLQRHVHAHVAGRERRRELVPLGQRDAAREVGLPRLVVGVHPETEGRGVVDDRAAVRRVVHLQPLGVVDLDEGLVVVELVEVEGGAEEELALGEVAAEAEVVRHEVDRRRDLVVGAAVEGRVLVAVAGLARVAGVQHQALAHRDLEAGPAGLAHVTQVERGQAQVDVVLDRVEARDGRVGRSVAGADRVRRRGRNPRHVDVLQRQPHRVRHVQDARRRGGVGRARGVRLPVGVLVPGEVEQEPSLLAEQAADVLVVVADVDGLRVEEVLLVGPAVCGARNQDALGNLLVLLELRGVTLCVVELAGERERAFLAVQEAVLLLLGPPLGRDGKRERAQDRGEGERANEVLGGHARSPRLT